MLSRSAKALYFSLASPLMRLNGARHRWFRRRALQGARAHLGPGQKNYIAGWVNVDANAFTARCDIWADLRHPLPFPNESLAAVYSHHVVEHLPDLKAHFADVHRCLRPGGLYRVGGPHGDSAIRKFLEGDRGWFSDFPDRRESIGGRLENFIFCRGEHLTILTRSYLEELMSSAGFTDIRVCLPASETGYPEIFRPCLDFEEEPDPECPHTLILEGRKP